MAKAKKAELPTVDSFEEVQMDSAAESVIASPAVQQVAVEHRQLAVPLANVPFGYLPRRIDMRKLTGRQSQALRQLQEALDQQGVKLANGSRIGNPGNAIKWLLESLAAT